MNGFFRFIFRYYIVGLFILLEVLAFAIILQRNTFHRAVFSNYMLDVSGTMYNVANEISDYVGLREVNKKLLQENAELRSRLPESFRNDSDSITLIKDTLYRQQYEYIPANVVGKTVNKQYNYLTLDKGLKNGIDMEMAVICSEGIVGMVTDVSDNFCVVTSLLNKDFRVNARLKSSDYFGVLMWDGENITQADLNDIPHHAKLIQGDTVVTSGFSSIFPNGLNIGNVSSFQIKDGNFYSITVNLSTDFGRLRHVMIVKNYFREEQDILERGIERR